MNSDAKTPFKIVYEDNHLLVIIKPHGVVSEVDEYHTVALDSLMKDFIKKRDKKPGNVFLTPIHRLDKPASGLVILAKTSKALERMHKLMRERMIDKTYIACLEKAPPFDEGHLVHYLEHKKHHAAVCRPPEGKRAELDFKVLEKTAKGTWVSVSLHTGRYHQIRAQFSALGCPIVGDTRYGSSKHLKDEAIALIHTRASFCHPVTQQDLVIEHPEAQARLDAFLDKLQG
jgi:23S rRNA pseudouridine1911/1915/1917 synthase